MLFTKDVMLSRDRYLPPLGFALALTLGLVACNFFSDSVLSSITVSPSTPTVAVGSTQQFTATGVNNDGSTSSVTASWTSSDTTVATIGASTGLATAVKAGTTTVTATTTGSSPLTATTTMTVTASAITAITVTDATSGTIATIGGTDQVRAVARFADGTTTDITSSATWTSSNTALVTVTSPGGLATGVAAGSAQITASSGNVTSAPFTINVL